MRHFQNILVGVDFTPGARAGVPELSPDNQEALWRAVWLARHNSAKLLLFTALQLPERTLHALARSAPFHLLQTVEETIHEALAALVKEVRGSGVEARGELVQGRAWLEIIRQVLRESHDLVVVGARHLHGLRKMLFGSTATNLVRKCPCPVWVTKSNSDSQPLKVLVASDFSAVSDDALSLGLSLKTLAGAKVHVLHAVEYALDHRWSTGQHDVSVEEYHAKIRAEALQKLHEQMRRVYGGDFPQDVELHLAEQIALPDLAILQFTREHHIDLLAIGTIGRNGIPGMLVGNTAERLLPGVTCSVLAVKPTDFRCPITLE